MVKQLAIIVVCLFALSLLYAFVIPNLRDLHPQPVGCTLEAKICPDGTAVGRVGPHCEFAQCPSD